MDKNIENVDTEDRDKLMESAVRLDSLSPKEFPKELLDRVSGGDTTVEWGTCRRCGGQLYASFGKHMVIFCSRCPYRETCS